MPSPVQKFDVIVIGAGSGLNIASAAAQKGLKVAIVEEGPMGGTCLNRGCIPSKILIHSADVMETLKTAEKFGIKVKGFELDFPKIVHRANDHVDEEAAQIEGSIRRHPQLTLFKARGKFVGLKLLEVEGHQITAPKIFIAAGTRVFVPPIQGLDSVPYLTSTEALRLEKLPPSLTVVGGGYIAAELAHFFGALGSKITIVERGSRMLGAEDQAVSAAFTQAFAKKYDVLLGHTVEKVEKKGNEIVAHAKGSDGSVRKISSSHLLVAVGRVPNSDLLQVEKTGVKVNPKGFVEVNEFMETSVPGIWALGDICGKYLFKHSANYEGEIAYNNAFSPSKKMKVNYAAMPHAVFSSPQVAGVGFTEQELRQKGLAYRSGRYPYSHTGMGKALEEEEGFVKVLLEEKSDRILGCHILGPEAATLLHEVLVSMRYGPGTAESISETIHIHPALSEVVQRAFGSV